MVYGVVQNVRLALKNRGGWKGLLEHMYTNGDYPFKVGTFQGQDPAGNKYYENRVDYPFGQHRWVEPGDIHNFDSSSIPPEWHGWMTSMNDTPPSSEEEYFDSAKANIRPVCKSNSPTDHAVGHQEPIWNFHHLHNQTSVRSRGYGVGNPQIGLPAFGVKDAYYTQPGSPYNENSMKKLVMIGDLDEGDASKKPEDHRRFKSLKWADRLRTAEEKDAIEKRNAEISKKAIADALADVHANRTNRMRSRGRGTVI
mmetsp:Transcript_54130/g.80369  ORF Transcript_54130/g.80369 Transcript_54130/m.80369 type:complete len:254 (-) Transcript_54130:52-813(-)|eukprot:CAMPEP_0195507762 /NCGR_PEP_ID=MMETSP0794_2-20130614/1147_1 /TAXON_ID=515487 /ORGANISM="Stephanopyxis turris, Strain CCMP 815" /LENGTH=253 /DNA_ID=CAMNT_0040634549 /DNA_START=46 /DNA_END=807 /DNA_ORIENTATION=+